MPKDFSRTDRVADLIQRELSLILQRESYDPRLAMITVSAVKVSRDLAQAKVYVTAYQINDKATMQEMLQALNKAAGFLRSTLAKKIQIRTIPQLRFVYDESIEYGNRLSKLIDNALNRDEPDEP